MVIKRRGRHTPTPLSFDGFVRGSNARWSPGGDRILYTAEGTPKGTQVFVRYLDAEGGVSQVTRVENAPTVPT